MEFSVTIIGIILLLGAIQGLLLSTLLFTKFSGYPANRYLAFLILFYSLFVLDSFLINIESIYLNYPHLTLLLNGLPYLFGPLHLIYLAELTDSRLRFAHFHWYHFIPFVVYKIFYLQIYFVPAEELIGIIELVKAGQPPWHIVFFSIFVAVQGMTYMIIALFTLREYAQKVKTVFSSLDRINLNWLRFFTYMAVFVWSIVFLENFLEVLNLPHRDIYPLVPLLTSIFVYSTGYIGLIKTEIFLQPEVSDNLHNASKLESEKHASKYQKSGLSAERAARYLAKLNQLMEHDRPYIDPTLTLKDLSERLNISTHNISEVLNTQLNQNFFDYINQYRVARLKELLTDSTKNHLTLFAIANEAGFNSKSAFNAIFKRNVGITPSQYREKIKSENTHRHSPTRYSR